MSTSGFDILQISPRLGVIQTSRRAALDRSDSSFNVTFAQQDDALAHRPSRGRRVTIPTEQGKKRLSLRAERPYVQEDLDGRARLVPTGGWIGAMKDIGFTRCRVADNEPAISV